MTTWGAMPMESMKQMKVLRFPSAHILSIRLLAIVGFPHALSDLHVGEYRRE
jgi:hypothetical protein